MSHAIDPDELGDMVIGKVGKNQDTFVKFRDVVRSFVIAFPKVNGKSIFRSLNGFESKNGMHVAAIKLLESLDKAGYVIVKKPIDVTINLPKPPLDMVDYIL